MKKIGLYISAFALAVGSIFTSCEDDKDTLSVQVPSASTLEQDVTSVVVTEDILADVLYTLKFSASDAKLENDGNADLGYGAYLVESSLSPDFSGNIKSEVVEIANGNNTKTYTGVDLSVLALSLGAEAEKPTSVYFRINHVYKENTSLGTLSNVVELNLTPFNVIPTLNVVSKDGSQVVAKLIYNEQTKLYEGEYTYTEWNFYFVDIITGEVYGCDDDYTKPEDGVNRSYKLVKGRSIGDDYSMWFDPSIRPVTMKVDLEKMEWNYERIATEKKDLTGVTVLMVGDDLGWNDGWAPSDEIPGVVVTKDGDEYTAVFENMELTSTGGFGFRATEPAAAWIGKGGISVSEPIIEGENNLQVSETGVYTVTFKAVAEADGSISYSLSAEKTGNSSKKDLSGVSILIVGGDMGWFDSWKESTDDVPGVKFTTTDDVNYTAVFKDIALTQTFGFRATAPAPTWMGASTFTTISDRLGVDADSGNPYPTESGLYTITINAVAEDDGNITFSLMAEKTADLTAQDLTNKQQGIKGAFDDNSSDWVIIGKVAPVVNDNVYTYTIASITLAENQEFGFDGDLTWVGKGDVTVNSDLISEDGNALSVKEAGTYTFVLVATANNDGTISYTLDASK